MLPSILTGLGVVAGAGIVGALFMRGRASRSWGRLTDMRSMEGKVIIITGANTGLGYDAALELAKRKAVVILACRNLTEGRKAVDAVRAVSRNENIHCLELDLSSLESVRHFAKEFIERFDSLDVLVCNAGVWCPMDQKKKTEDGYEIHFGVNHLGHFLLIDSLKEHLTSGRIVMVSSTLMNHGEINMETKDFVYDGRIPIKSSHIPTGYADSKLMNGLVAKELSKRGFESIAVCPGWCKTKLARYVHMSWFRKCIFSVIACMFMRSSLRGSENIVQAVLEEENFVNGGFYRECRLAENENEKIENLKEIGEQLWDFSMQLIK